MEEARELNQEQEIARKASEWAKKWDALYPSDQGLPGTRNLKVDGLSSASFSTLSSTPFNYIRTSELLRQYSCSTTKGYTDLFGYIGGSFGRFFTGRWNSHHGNAVQNALQHYGCANDNGTYSYDQSDVALTTKLLGRLKFEIGNDPIKPDGDFAAILTTIYEKTGINFYELEAAEVDLNEEIAEQKTFDALLT